MVEAKKKSYCILVNRGSNDLSLSRLEIMEKTNDGFKIADEDLILRGPGDYVGYQQSGFVKYKIANMITDGAIIRKARVLAAELIKEDPLLEIDSQPFLASSYDDAMKLYMASKPEIVKGLDSKGLVFLYAVPWPAQGLYSKKEINSKDDLKGLKFRAYNSSLIRLAELTGMAPTKIEAAEISQAFSTGAVESMITSPTTGKNSKIWENGVKYFYDIAAWYPKNMIIVNKDAWSKLDSATQKLVMSEAAIAEKKGWALSKKGNTADKKALADAGMTVGKVNSALNNHFKEVGSTMSKEWASRAGSRGQSVLAAYN